MVLHYIVEGLLKVIWQIRAYLRNFLWSFSSTRARARACWDDVSEPKSIGRLNLTDPEEALQAFMAKWILKAQRPGESNLQVLLRHKIQKVKPNSRGTWPHSLQRILTHKFSAPKGHRIWNRLIQSWKRFNPKIDIAASINGPIVLSTPLWWSTHFYANNFGFSYLKVVLLARHGFRFFHDMWSIEQTRFLTWQEILTKFPLKPTKQTSYFMMTQSIPDTWVDYLTNKFYDTNPGKYV